MNRFQITEYCHFLVKSFAGNPSLCIDATMGNGTDTEFLCRLVGEKGKVLAFDIQKIAEENTAKRLAAVGLNERAELILGSHEMMGDYAAEGTADVIMFNFGYLPGGDHSLSTGAETSIPALDVALRLLKNGGIACLCIYSGGDSGFKERDALLEYIKSLDSKKYLAITHEYFNRPNNPPLPVLIKKL